MARASHLRRVPQPSGRIERQGEPGAERESAAAGSPFALATLEEPGPDGRWSLRTPGGRLDARLATIAGWSPCAGDEVLVAAAGGTHVAIAVLRASRPLALVGPDGARVELAEGAVEVKDGAGRLLVRCADGVVEVAPASGDLRLAAPEGRVRIEAGLDVSISARRDAVLTAERSAELRGGPSGGELASTIKADAAGVAVRGDELVAHARVARATAGDASLVAREIRTRAERIEAIAARVETTAEHVSTRAKRMVQEVSGLLESRLGRVRTLVDGAFSLRTRSTALRSREDTSVDGRRVLLG